MKEKSGLVEARWDGEHPGGNGYAPAEPSGALPMAEGS